MPRRRILFVTGTRAEFGLMEQTLRRIRAHRALELQLVVTGMHLSREHGYSVAGIRRQGWTIDATVPWRGSVATATGQAMSGLAKVIDRLRPDVVLVVGDRVEAFAAASAAHLAGCVVAHVHGGDRALGQVDDALRHAISKLAHLHFAATAASGKRLLRMGEDAFRVHVVGTPGLDDLPPIVSNCERTSDALVLLHPDNADVSAQKRQAQLLLKTMNVCGIRRGTVVYPNNDPGWQGIAEAWDGLPRCDWKVERNLPRAKFLATLGRAALLIGNSSSGIIEAASLRTPVINIGPRQAGRERSANVRDVDWQKGDLRAEIASVWCNGRPRLFIGKNVYGGGAAGDAIAELLAAAQLGPALRRKLIAY